LTGHKDVVQLLLKAGASTTLKMGDLSPVDIARDFDHPEILELFETK
jgi:ankyrin repeat protein